MELALLALLGLTLTRPFAMPPIRAALLVGLVAMALHHSRHQLLLGILAPMLLARPIAAAIGARACWRRGAARRALRAGGNRRGGAGDQRRAVHGADRPMDGGRRRSPRLSAVPPELGRKPVLNQYGFGGYLIWSHVRPFIDGRADMYGGAMLGLYGKLNARRSRGGGGHAQAL